MSDPGKDSPWADFLHYRHILILEFVKEGKSFPEIARILSMDPLQVQLISMTSMEQMRNMGELRDQPKGE